MYVSYPVSSLPKPRLKTRSTVGVWHFKFAAEIVADVTARTLTAEAPSYATIMELDKKVREFPLLEGYAGSTSDFGTSFQQCVLDHIRETSAFLLLSPLARSFPC